MASGLFLAASVLRLARWRLVRDAHSALVGAALLVIGGLCLPLGGFAHLFVPEESSPVVGLAIRCVASYVALQLVLRALKEEHRQDHRLYLLFQVLATALLLFLQAGELAEWREQLAHDARNAVAGLRAARRWRSWSGTTDAPTRTGERLRWAAGQEIGHLEHLLFRTPTQPCEPLDVSRVVRDVARSARALGEVVTAGGAHVYGIGRTDDLTAVLKGMLVNARAHAPGSRVDLRIVAAEGVIRIICSDGGPGLRGTDPERIFERGYRASTSPGSGLGLYAARGLMREQGGNLEVVSSRQGATFVVTLPAAAAPAREVLTWLTPPPLRLPAPSLTLRTSFHSETS